MSPPGWLLVAAAVLALAAGWCANAEAALTLVAATGVGERPENKGTLQTVTADLPRYMSVLLLLRAILECLVAGLVTATHGLVIATPVPAPPVATLGVAAHHLVP